MFQKICKKLSCTINLNNNNDSKYIFYNEYLEPFSLVGEVSDIDYKKINKIYLQGNLKTNNLKINKTYDYLINRNYNVVNSKDYYFFIIEKQDNCEIDFISLVEDMIPNAVVLEYKKLYVIIYFEPLELSIKSIANNLSEDFSVKLKVFEGFKMAYNEPKWLSIVICSYIYFMDKKTNLYSNLSDLLYEIVKKDYKLIEEFKPIVLKKLYKDVNYEKLIRSMFECNLNVTKTASAVYMHRNTINNKLETIKEETGLNIQNFKDASAMYFLITSK